MATETADPLRFFPYLPRPHQDDAVKFAAQTFASRSVGLLSADMGIGKTIAVLSGYLAARADDPTSRLMVLTRTHSQSDVFESELSVLRERQSSSAAQLTATSLVSRMHTCPIRDEMDSVSSTGFLRGCSFMIRTGRCVHYWNLYVSMPDGHVQLRGQSRDIVEQTLREGVVTRARAEETAETNTLCPYELMRWCARASRIIIGPYTYMFKTRVRSALLSSLGLALHDVDLLVDEAHNLPRHVLDSESATLRGDDVSSLRESKSTLEKSTGVKWLDEAVDFLHETMMLGLDELRGGGEKKLDKWEAVPRYVDSQELERLLSNIGTMESPDVEIHTETPLDRLVEYLYTGLLAAQSDEWHITMEVAKGVADADEMANVKLVVRPLNASGLCAPVLRGVRSAVLMSGTLRPIDHNARLLGIAGSALLDLSSPYPRSSRLVLIDSDVETSYKKRNPDMWRAIADRISAALVAMPSNKSALIAFPSYSVMDAVLSFGIETGFRSRVVENKGDRIEDLRSALKEGPSAVFLVYSGKFSEGMDFVDEGRSMIDLIIGVGIPFTPPSEYQAAIEEFYDSRFWAGAGHYLSSVVPAVRSVAQLIGRLRRSPEDWGVVMLLDRRFLKHLDVFGPDFPGDTWIYSGVHEAVEAIATFLQSRGQEVAGV